MVAILNNKGKLGVVVPHGVLFRGAAEGKIRENLLKEGIVEAVIGLPQKLFYGTGIPAAILVINKNKPLERKDSVLFIAADKEYEEGKNQNALRDQDIEKIVQTYRGYKDIPKYCRVVPFSEIKENDYNLNISRYVDTLLEEETIDVAEALKELQRLEAEKQRITAKMNEYMNELGYF
jgi:type I restriction enzyme M protein